MGDKKLGAAAVYILFIHCRGQLTQLTSTWKEVSSSTNFSEEIGAAND
jgi:hypothetical protein